MEGGMQRRERGGSKRYYLRPKLQLLSRLGTGTEEEDEKEIYEHEGTATEEKEDETYNPRRRNNRKQSRKKRKTTDGRPWGYLPIDLLFSIANMLQIVDFFNFGKVCKQWRLCVSTYKQNFMSTLSPLVLYITSNAKRSCHFYDMSTGCRYKTMLPTIVRRFCIGCSSGYLIMGDNQHNVWVINPLSRHQFNFTNMPHSVIFTGYLSDRAIFASFGSGSDFALIVLSKKHQIIWYCISRDTSSWMSLSFAEEKWDIVDMVVFNGRVFVLTDDLRIGVINLRTQKMSFMTLGGIPNMTRCNWLVASKKQLLIVDLFPLFRATVYTIDFEGMKWVEVKDLGDEALFLDECKGSKLGSTSNGKGMRNCVYHLPYHSSLCYVYGINGYSRGNFPIFLPFKTTKVYCWYSLHQAYGPDNIKDEDEDES